MKISIITLASLAAFVSAIPTKNEFADIPPGVARIVQDDPGDLVPLPFNGTDKLGVRQAWPEPRFFKAIWYEQEVPGHWWGGTCWTFWDAERNDQVSSMIVKQGTYCHIWPAWECGGGYHLHMSEGGYPDFRDFGFNDVMSSYACWTY